MILVEILRILLWRQTGLNDAWLEDDLICGKNVSEVCQPRDSKMNLTVVKVSKKLVGILFALVKDTFWGLLSAIVCNLQTFVGHFISSIWLKFGMKSCFRVLITEWISKTSSYFCMAKKRESALGLPILMPINIAHRKWSFKFNSSPIVKISWNLVISIKRSFLPHKIYFKTYGKCLVLLTDDSNILGWL